MKKERSDNGSAELLVVVGVLAVALGVWQFSRLLGLDITTGGKVLLSLLVLCVGIFLARKLEVKPGGIAPTALAGLWASFWPALDYWAAKSSFVSAFAQPDTYPVVWWNAWYTKWGVLLAILVIGYGWRWWQRNE